MRLRLLVNFAHSQRRKDYIEVLQMPQCGLRNCRSKMRMSYLGKVEMSY